MSNPRNARPSRNQFGPKTLVQVSFVRSGLILCEVLFKGPETATSNNRSTKRLLRLRRTQTKKSPTTPIAERCAFWSNLFLEN
jgi:hypothetical protein